MLSEKNYKYYSGLFSSHGMCLFNFMNYLEMHKNSIDYKQQIVKKDKMNQMINTQNARHQLSVQLPKHLIQPKSPTNSLLYLFNPALTWTGTLSTWFQTTRLPPSTSLSCQPICPTTFDTPYRPKNTFFAIKVYSTAQNNLPSTP